MHAPDGAEQQEWPLTGGGTETAFLPRPYCDGLYDVHFSNDVWMRLKFSDQWIPPGATKPETAPGPWHALDAPRGDPGIKHINVLAYLPVSSEHLALCHTDGYMDHNGTATTDIYDAVLFDATHAGALKARQAMRHRWKTAAIVKVLIHGLPWRLIPEA